MPPKKGRGKKIQQEDIVESEQPVETLSDNEEKEKEKEEVIEQQKQQEVDYFKARIASNKKWNVNGLRNIFKNAITNLENPNLLDITWKQTVAKNLITLNRMMLFLLEED